MVDPDHVTLFGDRIRTVIVSINSFLFQKYIRARVLPEGLRVRKRGENRPLCTVYGLVTVLPSRGVLLYMVDVTYMFVL